MQVTQPIVTLLAQQLRRGRLLLHGPLSVSWRKSAWKPRTAASSMGRASLLPLVAPHQSTSGPYRRGATRGTSASLLPNALTPQVDTAFRETGFCYGIVTLVPTNGGVSPPPVS